MGTGWPQTAFDPNSPAKGNSAQTQSVPACASLRSGVQAVAQAPPYVDEPVEQLKRMVPGLKGIESNPDEITKGSGPAQVVQDKAASILGKTGAVIASLLQRMPDLIAREEVRKPVAAQAIGGVRIDGAIADLAPNTLGAALNSGSRSSGSSAVRYETHFFTYRIVRRRNASGNDSLEEFRTDAHDRPIYGTHGYAGTPLSVGFATVWLYFLPGNLHDSRFRYLGKQSIGDNKTFVLAFAQISGETGLNTNIESTFGVCSTPLQGIVWIDQSTFQIVRVETDLLSPLPGIQLNQLRSITNYGAVRIHTLNLELWLPVDVETAWQTAYRTGQETHLYSQYRLFRSTTRILPPGKSQLH